MGTNGWAGLAARLSVEAGVGSRGTAALVRLVVGGMQYYAAVSHTDEQIGRVLDELRQSGLRKSTVVCFFT